MYVGNHHSFYDIILTYPKVPRPTGYVAKKGNAQGSPAFCLDEIPALLIP